MKNNEKVCPKPCLKPISTLCLGLIDNPILKIAFLVTLIKAPFHPKNQDVGEKDIFYSKKVFVESADADTFAANDNVTFINWGNIRITKINKKDGKVESVDAKLNLDDKDFKKTTKVTWLAEHPKCNWTPAVAVEFDNIITKPILEKDDDFKNFINRDSRKSEQLWGDHQLGCTKEYFFFQFSPVRR